MRHSHEGILKKMKKEYRCEFPKEQWPNVTYCIHYFENKCDKGCKYALEMESKLEKEINDI